MPTGQGAGEFQSGEERGRTSTTTRRGQSEQFGQTRERSFTGGETRTRTGVEGGVRGGGGVALSEQQRTRIHSVIATRRDIPRISRGSFDVRVGAVIPRSVRLVVVPTEIVRIYPRWRGYGMILVGD